jgi:hypothetical protein
VTPQVGSEHPEALSEVFLGESAEAFAVGHDAVEAEDGRGARIAPLVDVQEHAL